MDKILKKLIEDAVAPILEQLVALNAKFVNANPPAAIVNTAPGPAGMKPKEPVGQSAATERKPEPPVNVPADAIPVQSREALGKALIEIAKQGADGLELAMSILRPLQQPADEGTPITLSRVLPADYPKIAAAIAATAKKPAAAESIL